MVPPPWIYDMQRLDIGVCRFTLFLLSAILSVQAMAVAEYERKENYTNEYFKLVPLPLPHPSL